MKIVYIINHLATFGGIERIIADKMNFLAANSEHDIHLVTLSQSDNPLLFKLNVHISIHHLGINLFHKYKYNALIRPAVGWMLRRKLKRALQALIDELNPDVILTPQNCEVMTFCNLRTRATKVVEIHGARNHIGDRDCVITNPIEGLFYRKQKENLLRTIEERADIIVTLTDYDKKLWRCPEKMRVIPNAIRTCEPIKYNPESKRVMVAARLSYEKGLDRLVEAWKGVYTKHPDWSVDIYGSGVEESRLKALISEAKLENVIHILQPIKDIQSVMHEYAFLALTSLHEGFSLVLIESMMKGLPCLSTACESGPPAIVKDGEVGVLVENDNITALTQGLCRMIENKRMRERFSTNAHPYALQYSPEVVMPRWLDFFDYIKHKKVMFVTDSIASPSGMSRILTDKMNWLAENSDFEVYLCTSNQVGNPYPFPLSEKIHIRNLDVNHHHEYRHNALVRPLWKLGYNYLFKTKMKQLIRFVKPDILIATPYFKAKEICEMGKTCKVIIESHCALSHTGVNDGASRSAISTAFNKHTLTNEIKTIKRKADAIVCLTEGDSKEWNRETKTHVHVIPNITNSYPTTRYNTESKRIIAAGRLEYQKGFDLLFEAWKLVAAKHPDWKLELYGNGSQKNYLQRFVDNNKLNESVTINSARSNLIEQFHNYAFYVLSSRYEGFGLVLVEAMMHGLPCVSVNCKYGPSDIIKDGEDGLLSQDGDTADLAEKINWMIEHPDERTVMSESAYRNVQRYTTESIMPQWVNLFNQITERT